MMDSQEAGRAARQYVLETIGEEHVREPSVEEIEPADEGKVWRVTIGYNDPTQPTTNVYELINRLLSFPFGQSGGRRCYKVVQVNATTGQVQSMRSRQGD